MILQSPASSQWDNLGWIVKLIALKLSGAGMHLTTAGGLKWNKQGTNGISPTLPLNSFHKAFSDFWLLFPCSESPAYYGIDLFSLSKISHVSQTELFVNKTGRLRPFYLPFQGPDIRMFTQDGVAHAISAWKKSHNLPSKPTLPLPRHSVKTLCDAEDFVRRSESTSEKSTLRAPLSCTQTQPRKLLKPPQSKPEFSWQHSSSTVFLRYKF